MDTHDDYVLTLRNICEDASARRELLWIEAMEKGDLDDARELEGLDPDLPARVGAVERAAQGGLPEGPSRYTVLYDLVWDSHAARLKRERG